MDSKSPSNQVPDGLSLGFIGGGQMASALIKGIISSKLMPSTQIHCSDTSEQQLQNLKGLGVITTTNNREVAKCDVIVLAVKPGIIVPVLEEIRGELGPKKLVISIAAGVQMSTMEPHLPSGTRLARVMPNTPSLVGAGASVFSLGSSQPGDAQILKAILSAVGTVHEQPEKNLDAVTGVSGSGPAYIFVLIEALADGGVRAGLTRDVALSLAAQTVLGSAKMVLETGKHPGQLKDAVASPGGTTIAALHELEKGCFRGTVINAVMAASEHSKKLANSKL